METKNAKFNRGARVMVYGFYGSIEDTTDAPDFYGVTFDEHGKTYSVPGNVIEADNRPITERVKSLMDAINTLGEEHPYCQTLALYNEQINGNIAGVECVPAYLKLLIITAALNEGWTPDWGNSEEWKWYPWFTMYSKEEIDNMSAEDKRRVVGRANNVAYANYVSSNSYTNNGSRLAFKSEKLADYAAKQFTQIYADYLL